MLCKWRKAFRCEDLKAHELNCRLLFLFLLLLLLSLLLLPVLLLLLYFLPCTLVTFIVAGCQVALLIVPE